MKELEKLIMVVKKNSLLRKDSFEGFKPRGRIDYLARILDNFEYKKRDIVEKDLTYKQPIVYTIIVNPALKQVFTYQRSLRDEEYPEKRLQGKWSWGIGGHIEEIDTTFKDPIQASMSRELREEVVIQGNKKFELLGYINYDSPEIEEVHRVHFGILWICKTSSRNVQAKNPEIKNAKLRSIKDLDKIYLSSKVSVELWSRISLKPLKLYLQRS